MWLPYHLDAQPTPKPLRNRELVPSASVSVGQLAESRRRDFAPLGITGSAPW